MRRTRSSLSDIALNAPVVMAQRMSRMMLPDAMKNASDFAEDKRMVEEKAKAAMDGMFAAQIEMSSQMMNAWIGMAFGKMPQPIHAADAITEAALKPMRGTVNANAKRLTKRNRAK